MTEQRDPVTTVYVLHPERWWIATRADLPWLTDPDKDDGRVRWSDRDERQWGTIAGVIEAAGRALASGAHDVDQDDPTVAFVPVDLAGFAPADRNIVTSWFRAGSEAPSTDPWEDGLMNGRHRLWSTWRAVPGALLPVYSGLLPYLDDVPIMGEELARGVAQSAIDGLRRIPAAPANRSPRYVEELRRVAREAGHDVGGLPRLVAEPRRSSWWARLRGRQDQHTKPTTRVRISQAPRPR